MHVTPEPAKILKLNVEGLKKEENHNFILKAEKLKVKEVEIYLYLCQFENLGS